MDEKETMQYQIELLDRVKNELGMKQSDISKKFEVGYSVVSKWVNGKAPLTKATQIALELMLERKEDKEIIDWVKKSSHIIELVKQK